MHISTAPLHPSSSSVLLASYHSRILHLLVLNPTSLPEIPAMPVSLGILYFSHSFNSRYDYS